MNVADSSQNQSTDGAGVHLVGSLGRVDGDVLEREPTALGSQHEVHRYLRALEKTVVGFCWSWRAEDCR